MPRAIDFLQEQCTELELGLNPNERLSGLGVSRSLYDAYEQELGPGMQFGDMNAGFANILFRGYTLSVVNNEANWGIHSYVTRRADGYQLHMRGNPRVVPPNEQIRVEPLPFQGQRELRFNINADINRMRQQWGQWVEAHQQAVESEEVIDVDMEE